MHSLVSRFVGDFRTVSRRAPPQRVVTPGGAAAYSPRSGRATLLWGIDPVVSRGLVVGDGGGGTRWRAGRALQASEQLAGNGSLECSVDLSDPNPRLGGTPADSGLIVLPGQ